MNATSIEFSIFLIFAGAAVLATIAMFARQTLLVAYILLGMILGPSGVALVNDPMLISDISTIGIIFLLYLLGLDLLPQQLMRMLGVALSTTLISSLIFFVIGICIGYIFNYNTAESAMIGITLTFSSTIIGVKLMPTTSLHHKHTGQMIISVLLIQDLFAIIVLLFLQGFGVGDNLTLDILWQIGMLPILIGISWLFERYILERLITKFDQIHEYIFLLAIAWCLSIAELAALLGLSHEIGAFIAGVTLASSPIAFFITEKLKPLRDFFLIIFFFSLGASFNIESLGQIILPAIILTIVVIAIKPLVFKVLFVKAGESPVQSQEVGVRLGQVSEFSLLIAILAVESGVIGLTTSYLIQFTTLLTFVISSYYIVLKYPTPIAISDRLRRD